MGAVPVIDGTLHPADPGVWLTDREPGELLGARRVVVCVGETDPIVVAEVEGRREAEELAEQMVELIEHAAATGEWLELGDRIVRPGAITSVDVERVE